jgi:hypothetical protein
VQVERGSTGQALPPVVLEIPDALDDPSDDEASDDDELVVPSDVSVVSVVSVGGLPVVAGSSSPAVSPGSLPQPHADGANIASTASTVRGRRPAVEVCMGQPPVLSDPEPLLSSPTHQGLSQRKGWHRHQQAGAGLSQQISAPNGRRWQGTSSNALTTPGSAIAQ